MCGFLIIKPQTHCTMRCDALLLVVWLCHFAGSFGVVFVICAVWRTPIVVPNNMFGWKIGINHTSIFLKHKNFIIIMHILIACIFF